MKRAKRRPGRQRSAMQKTLRKLGRHEMARRIEERSCGSCTFCCTSLSVEETTAAHEPCCHLGAAGGCAVYKKRPKACRTFLCSWRMGYGEDDARPDRAGALVEIRAGTAGRTEGNIFVFCEGPYDESAILGVLRDIEDLGDVRVAVGFVGKTCDGDSNIKCWLHPNQVIARNRYVAQTGTAPWNSEIDVDDGEAEAGATVTEAPAVVSSGTSATPGVVLGAAVPAEAEGVAVDLPTLPSGLRD